MALDFLKEKRTTEQAEKFKRVAGENLEEVLKVERVLAEILCASVVAGDFRLFRSVAVCGTVGRVSSGF
jgi:hypothetical protein